MLFFILTILYGDMSILALTQTHIIAAFLINQSITGFVNVAVNSKSATMMIQRRRIAMVNQRRVEKDVPSVNT